MYKLSFETISRYWATFTSIVQKKTLLQISSFPLSYSGFPLFSSSSPYSSSFPTSFPSEPHFSIKSGRTHQITPVGKSGRMVSPVRTTAIFKRLLGKWYSHSPSNRWRRTRDTGLGSSRDSGSIQTLKSRVRGGKRVSHHRYTL